MRRFLLLICFFYFASLLSGCANLYHVQVGQIDGRDPLAVWVPFDVMVSETGVSTEEIGKLARATGGQAGKQASDAAAIVSLFQMGPRTGNLVYNENYAQKLIYLLHEKCPSGRITGLTSIREQRKYPVISGEIVKVSGYCLKTRKTSQRTDS